MTEPSSHCTENLHSGFECSGRTRNERRGQTGFVSLPEIAASVMMRRTSFSIWELLHISSHVPLTCICSASTISCLWLGTTKLITYDWSLKIEHERGHGFSWFPHAIRRRGSREPDRRRILPVGVGTDVVYEGAVFQNSLHFSQRDVLACLQFHQVLLTVCWGGGHMSQS